MIDDGRRTTLLRLSGFAGQADGRGPVFVTHERDDAAAGRWRKAGDKRPKMEDGRQRTDDRGQTTEDRGQRTEDGRRKTEDGIRRTEDPSSSRLSVTKPRQADDGGQMTANRGRSKVVENRQFRKNQTLCPMRHALCTDWPVMRNTQPVTRNTQPVTRNPQPVTRNP